MMEKDMYSDKMHVSPPFGERTNDGLKLSQLNRMECGKALSAVSASARGLPSKRPGKWPFTAPAGIEGFRAWGILKLVAQEQCQPHEGIPHCKGHRIAGHPKT